MESIGKLIYPVRVMKRAIKFASKDANRPALQAVFLAGNGDVVSTDAFRLMVEHRMWEGESLTIDYATAHDIASCKVKGNDGAAEFFRDGEKLVVRIPDGTEIIGAEHSGSFPAYAKLFEGLEPVTTAYVGKQLKPILDEHAKLKQDVRLDVSERDLVVSGMGVKGAEPTGRFEKWCDGGDASFGLDPKLLKPIMAELKWEARIGITASTKPAIIRPLDGSWIEFLLMPVRLGGEKKEAKEARKERDMEKIKNEQVDKAVMMAAIHNQAIERAASDPDSKVEGGKLTDSQRMMLHRLAKAGRLTSEESGDLTAWSLDGEFVCCIERRWSKRKIHLTYPELKPICHRGNLIAERKAMQDAVAERAGVEAEVAASESGGVTAFAIEPPKKAPKAPKAKAPKAPAPPVEMAAKTSLEVLREAYTAKPSAETCKAYLEERFKDERNTAVTQKREGCPVWVEGNTKPFQAELKELGLRWSPNRKGWYYRVA